MNYNKGRKPLNIALLGLNDLGRRVLEYLQYRAEDELLVITEKVKVKLLQEFNPDLILSVGYRYILKKDVLSIPRMGAINFHKSLLPMNRGANPVFWTIFEGTRAGVSIHYMDEGIDSGPIIAQQEVPVLPEDTAGTLYAKLEDVQIELFRKIWPDIRAENRSAVPQIGKPTGHTIQEFKDLRKIDPDKQMTVRAFMRYLKAMTFPGFKNAYIELDGKKFFVEIQIHDSMETQNSPKLKETLLKQYGF